MAFIRTLLLIAVFYYIFRFIGKVLVPLFVANRVNKMAGDFQKQQNHYSYQEKRQEGKVTITNAPKHKKMASNDVGEYVNYEEVD